MSDSTAEAARRAEEAQLRVGDKVRTRMLGRKVETVVLETRLRRARRRMEYRVAIPEGIEMADDFTEQERSYVRRERADGGFWFYALGIEKI